MAQVKQYTVYTFDELSDRAKETARDWLRQLAFSDNNDWDFVYQDAVNLGALIGIEIATKSFRTVGGGHGSEPAIYFSGFSSQGDGACFEGSYSYAKGGLKALKAEIGGESDGDKELIRIATELQKIQRAHFYQIHAKMSHTGRYMHSGCMSVDVENWQGAYATVAPDYDDEVTQLMRDFADWIYDQLRREYEYQTSDEQIDESMEANGYTFDEDGNRED